jgi:hypothetical protein
MSLKLPISRSVLVCAAMVGLVACDGSRSTAPKITPTAPRLAVVDNEQQLPFAFDVATCDEVVHISGVFHVVVAETDSPSGNEHFRFHINAKGTGVGATSGATYQWNDAINDTENFNGESGVVISAPQTTALVGQGGVSDIHFRVRFHVTVNANGELTVLIDQFEAICE